MMMLKMISLLGIANRYEDSKIILATTIRRRALKMARELDAAGRGTRKWSLIAKTLSHEYKTRFDSLILKNQCKSYMRK